MALKPIFSVSKESEERLGGAKLNPDYAKRLNDSPRPYPRFFVDELIVEFSEFNWI